MNPLNGVQHIHNTYGAFPFLQVSALLSTFFGFCAWLNIKEVYVVPCRASMYVDMGLHKRHRSNAEIKIKLYSDQMNKHELINQLQSLTQMWF